MTSLLKKPASYATRRPYPRQQGFGLLVFVAILGVIAFNLMMGNMSTMIRNDNATRGSTEKRILSGLTSQLATYYNSNLANIDSSAKTPAVVAAEAAEFLTIPSKSRVVYYASEPLSGPDGIVFRRWVLYVPSMTEESNPPDVAGFVTSGTWKPCTNPAALCVPGTYTLFSSDQLHREASNRAYQSMSKVVLKAQSYFKTKMLQDPQHSTVPNYFRVESNNCSYTNSDDIGCIDTYTPLATISGTTMTRSDTAIKLQLSEDELLSPWGTILEMSNKEDSEYQAVPYTASFRYRGPNGTYITMKSVQQF